MLERKVISNIDPLKMGRIQIETGEWLFPVSDEGIEFDIPKPGDIVKVSEDCYFAGDYNVVD